MTLKFECLDCIGSFFAWEFFFPTGRCARCEQKRQLTKIRGKR